MTHERHLRAVHDPPDQGQDPGGEAAAKKEAGRDNKAAYLFLLPWLIGLVVITLGPMLASLYLSFTDYNLIQAPEWIGLTTTPGCSRTPRLHNSLRVTFIYVFVSVPLQLALALGIAMLLNEGMQGLPFYRSIFYLPSMLGSSVAIALLWRQIFGTDGLVNQVLRLFGFEATTAGSPTRVRAGDDHPAARLDVRLTDGHLPGRPAADPRHVLRGGRRSTAPAGGPSSRKITLPLLSPIIFFNLVLQIIGAFQAFTQAFVVSGGTGGPSDSTMFYTLYLYQKGFGQFQMGYASAMAWLLLVIIAAFTAINFFALKVLGLLR